MWYKNLLHNETKKMALAEHKIAVEKYNGVIETVRAEGELLYQTRKRTIELILSIEDFVNNTTYTRQEFAPNLERINVEYSKFRQTEDYAASEVEKVLGILSKNVAVVVAGGRAIADSAPNAVMWVATTFGKASTRTAISELSGAAQKKAALAWLGGGAKAVGGGGISAGQARLALAGPILGVSVFATAGSILLIRSFFGNKKIAKQFHEDVNAMKIAGEILTETCAKISHIRAETEEMLSQVSGQYHRLEPLKNRNDAELSKDDQLELGILVYRTLALTEMLNRVVE